MANYEIAGRINLHAFNSDSASSTRVVATMRLNYWSPKNTGSLLCDTSTCLPLGRIAKAEQKHMQGSLQPDNFQTTVWENQALLLSRSSQDEPHSSVYKTPTQPRIRNDPSTI